VTGPYRSAVDTLVTVFSASPVVARGADQGGPQAIENT
jgi:hypothetical protein